MDKKVKRFFLYVFLTAFLVVFVVPFGFAVYTSLLGKADIGKLVSINRLTLENYIYVFFNSDLFIWYKNSFIMTIGILVGNLLINTMAAYALARIKFPGRNIAFFIIIGMMMVPYQLCLIPTYSMIVKLGWINSFKGLILPFLFQGFLVFLMRQFYSTLPKEIEEAAKIDGLTTAGTFFRIILPMSKTALAAQIIFCFSGTWNSFVWPVTLVNDNSMYVLTVGLNTLKNRYFEWPNITMTGVVLLTLPVAVMFILFQKHIIQGIASTGIKG